jgi:hypothetical protein
MIFRELNTPNNELILLLRNQIFQADKQFQPGYLTWDALSNLIGNVGDTPPLDYDSFQNLLDANPEFKQEVMQNVKRYDGKGIELKTKTQDPKKAQPAASGEVAKMAKAATARRQNESQEKIKESMEYIRLSMLYNSIKH